MVKEFVLVISMWGNNGTTWEYIGNQYIMQQTFTETQCTLIAEDENWGRVMNNKYYRLQFDCFHKDDHD
tara:strand:+ start:400 stop:606 length:207 start_codon:yes stop_codon:yes gene_type:complete